MLEMAEKIPAFTVLIFEDVSYQKRASGTEKCSQGPRNLVDVGNVVV